jgi:hypothetical protein
MPATPLLSSGNYLAISKAITIVMSVMLMRPIRKKMSAIFSYLSDMFFARMDAYENRHEARKKTIVQAVISSSSDLSAKAYILIMPNITKHNPRRFEAVGSICLDIFVLSSGP